MRLNALDSPLTWCLRSLNTFAPTATGLGAASDLSPAEAKGSACGFMGGWQWSRESLLTPGKRFEQHSILPKHRTGAGNRENRLAFIH